MVTKKCLEILSSGGVIIYPTDTVYGIGCDATNLSSISKINEIKNRKSNTPLICLMNGLEMVKNYVADLPDVSEKYLLDPNEPTTVIFNKSKNIDSYPTSIAVRIPKNKICLQLINKLKKPISGLYAAGEMVGGIFYNNYPGGSGLTSGSVFGRIAGKNAASKN